MRSGAIITTIITALALASVAALDVWRVSSAVAVLRPQIEQAQAAFARRQATLDAAIACARGDCAVLDALEQESP